MNASPNEQEIAYRVVDSPVGSLLLAATEDGLVRLAFAAEDRTAVLDRLAWDLDGRVVERPERLAVAKEQIEEYFAGGRRQFDLPLDLSGAFGWRRAILDRLPAIAYGETASYGEVAAAVERPGAARAVGTACATNPLPIVIPCHRVVRGDGTIGGYLGGPGAKRVLLALEAAAPKAA